jgi:hypothetical protein
MINIIQAILYTFPTFSEFIITYCKFWGFFKKKKKKKKDVLLCSCGNCIHSVLRRGAAAVIHRCKNNL